MIVAAALGLLFLTGDDSSTGITHFSTDMLERGLPYESRGFDGELDAPEEHHAVQGVSGRNYAMVDQRVPDRLCGRGRENVQDRGRSPTRRWDQQSGYHEQIGSRGRYPEQLDSRGSSVGNRPDDTTSVVPPYGRSRSADSERTDQRRQNVRNAINSFRGRRSSNQSRPGFQRSRSAAPFHRGASSNEPGVSVSAVPPFHQRRPWLPTGACAAVNEVVAKSDEALKSPTGAANMVRTLREVKAHAASCLHTYLCEPPSGQPTVTFVD